MAYAAALQALADPTRRAIFERLREGPQPVGELAADLPVSRPAVSQHLRVLREADLVREERQGTRNLYSVAPEGLEELRYYLDSFWGEVLDSFKKAVEKKAKGGNNARTNGTRSPKNNRR
jgi:DNA-binding transcriptional ArsR family regulator